MATKKVEICLKKKKPPRAQVFRYFRINNYIIKMWQTVAAYLKKNHFINPNGCEPRENL